MPSPRRDPGGSGGLWRQAPRRAWRQARNGENGKRDLTLRHRVLPMAPGSRRGGDVARDGGQLPGKPPPDPAPGIPGKPPPEVDRHGGAAAPDGRPAGRPGRAGDSRKREGGSPCSRASMGGLVVYATLTPPASHVSAVPVPARSCAPPLVRRHVPGLVLLSGVALPPRACHVPGASWLGSMGCRSSWAGARKKFWKPLDSLAGVKQSGRPCWRASGARVV